jgi:Ca2+-binding EF-hand superfamily protein
MSNGQSAQAQAPAKSMKDLNLPGQNLSLEETLRVMDVAREMRDRRETAEEMFRRDDLRGQLREKIMRTAKLAGDNVTEAEVEAAIQQYFETLHTYEDPPAGLRSLVAHGWVWRNRIMMGAAALVAVAGSFWFLFG